MCEEQLEPRDDLDDPLTEMWLEETISKGKVEGLTIARDLIDGWLLNAVYSMQGDVEDFDGDRQEKYAAVPEEHREEVQQMRAAHSLAMHIERERAKGMEEVLIKLRAQVVRELEEAEKNDPTSESFEYEEQFGDEER